MLWDVGKVFVSYIGSLPHLHATAYPSIVSRSAAITVYDTITPIWTRISKECFQHHVSSMPWRIWGCSESKKKSYPVLLWCPWLVKWLVSVHLIELFKSVHFLSAKVLFLFLFSIDVVTKQMVRNVDLDPILWRWIIVAQVFDCNLWIQSRYETFCLFV